MRAATRPLEITMEKHADPRPIAPPLGPGTAVGTLMRSTQVNTRAKTDRPGGVSRRTARAKSHPVEIGRDEAVQRKTKLGLSALCFSHTGWETVSRGPTQHTHTHAIEHQPHHTPDAPSSASAERETREREKTSPLFRVPAARPCAEVMAAPWQEGEGVDGLRAHVQQGMYVPRARDEGKRKEERAREPLSAHSKKLALRPPPPHKNAATGCSRAAGLGCRRSGTRGCPTLSTAWRTRCSARRRQR